MPVEDDINLDKPLTEKDIRKMEREAERIERAARKAERESKIIQDAAKTLIDYEEAQTKSPLSRMGGGPDHSTGTGFSGLGGHTPGSGVMSKGRRQAQSQDKSAIVTQKVKEMEAKIVEMSSEAYEAKQHRKALEMKISKVEGGIREAFNDFKGITGNPIAFGKGKAMGMLGKFGIYGAVAQFAISQAEQMIDEVWGRVVKAYGEGGIFDIRKLIKDETTKFHSIDYLTKVKAGKVIFTADAGQELRQGAPRTGSNTRELRDGHLKFIQFHYNT